MQVTLGNDKGDMMNEIQKTKKERLEWIEKQIRESIKAKAPLELKFLRSKLTTQFYISDRLAMEEITAIMEAHSYVFKEGTIIKG